MALRIVSGANAGDLFALGKTCFIGTQPHCDVQLSDPGIAHMHARVGLRGSSYALTDLTGEADVRVNGHVVKARKLVPGDRIRIADTEIEIGYADELVAAAPPEEAAAPDVLVVSTEDRPLTEVYRPESSPEVTPAPVATPAPAAAPASPPPAARPTTKTKRIKAVPSRRAAEPKPPPKPASKVPMLVGWGIVLLVVLGVGAGIVMSHRSKLRRIEQQARLAQEFERANPNKLEEAIERYKRVRLAAAGVHARMEHFLAGQITRCEGEVKARAQAFQDLLADLDARAASLAQEHDYAGAAAVYQVEDLKLRSRVLAERQGAIRQIEIQAQDYRDQQARLEAMRLAHLKKEGARQLKQAYDDAVDSMIEGRPMDAVADLESLLKERVAAYLPEDAPAGVRAATMTARLVKSFDAKIKAAEAAGDDEAISRATLEAPAPVKVILAIRKNDPLGARTNLDRIKDDVLYQSLLARASVSDSELQREKHAINQFALAWADVTGEKVTVIPRPQMCVETLEAAAQKRNDKEVRGFCQKLLNCRSAIANTRFAKRFDPVFALAEQLNRDMRPVGDKVASLGDGRIIQSEGSMFYAETGLDLSGARGLKLGLFKPSIEFSEPGSEAPVAAVADVTAVISCKALGKYQAVFTVPDNTKNRPRIGQAVLLRPGLSAGSVLVWNMPWLKKAAAQADVTRIAALSKSGRDVLVLAGPALAGAGLAKGRPVFFFRDEPGGSPKRVAAGRIDMIEGRWLVCSVTEGKRIVGGDMVSLEPKEEQPAAGVDPVPVNPALVKIDPLPEVPVAAPGPRVSARPAQRALFGRVQTASGGRLAIQTAVRSSVPPSGFLYMVERQVRHPHTDEPMLAEVGGLGISCKLMGAGTAVTCVPEAKLADGLTGKDVVLAMAQLNTKTVDFPSWNRSYTPGITSGSGDYWKPLKDSSWYQRGGRFSSGTALKGSYPYAVLSEPLGPHMQVDLDVRVDRQGESHKDAWVRDVMLEVYARDLQGGVTFSLGAEGEPGISVLGSCLAYLQSTNAQAAKPVLPSGAKCDVVDWGNQPPGLRAGGQYCLRIRRAADTVALYVNGIRLARVQVPRLSGDAELRVVAPERKISIVKSVTTDLPAGTKIPAAAPALGEFGYVLDVTGGRVVIDADGTGVESGRTMSVVSIVKSVRGQKSVTLMLKRVAQLQVVGVSSRIAIGRLAGESTDVKPGMKVFPGTVPETFTLTDIRLRDIERGL